MTNSKFEFFTTTMTLTMTQQADPIWLGERRPCLRSGRLAAATAEMQKLLCSSYEDYGYWLEKKQMKANSKALVSRVAEWQPQLQKCKLKRATLIMATERLFCLEKIK